MSSGAPRALGLAGPSSAEDPASRGTRTPTIDSTVLVIDGDAVSRRFVELAFAGHPSVAVEPVWDARTAFEILGTVMVDVIIAETTLPDMSGLKLLRELASSPRTRGIPVIFLSAENRAQTKLTMFENGAVDYLVKPCERSELVARSLAVVHRRRREREASRQRSYALAGDFSALPFPDLVSILEMSRRTGTLTVITKNSSGFIVFDAGRAVHAVFGNLAGKDAFYRFLAAGPGTFEFSAERPASAEFTLDESITALLMEGARQLDEKEIPLASDVRTPTGRPGLPSSRPAVSSTPPRAPSPAAVPDEASRVVARQILHGILEDFSLGTLMALTADQLGAFTREPARGGRFHVLLLSDLATGVRGMLALSSAPTEQLVMDGLSGVGRALVLNFRLRGERQLDVVLLDTRSAAQFRPALGRIPSLAIVAPLRGDLLALGAAGRVELGQTLDELPPTVLLGVGTLGTLRALEDLGPVKDGRSILGCVTGSFGEGRAELRKLLAVGLEIWGKSAEAKAGEA